MTRPEHGNTYFPAIDGLRAIAVLAVMIYHLVPQALPGGFAGVDVFFVISGFVVTGSLGRDRSLPFAQFLTSFYSRRLVRIMPALLVCLIVTVLLSEALIPEAWLSQSIATTGQYAFFGLSNFALVWTTDGYFAPAAENNPFTHTWSLGVEEQFYLIIPAILYLILRPERTRLNRAALVCLILACLASFVFSIRATRRTPEIAFYMLQYRFWELGAGVALCLLGEARRKMLVSFFGVRLVAWAGLALVASSLAFANVNAFPFPFAIPVVIGATLLVLAATSAESSNVSRWLSLPLMVRLGLVSYSLYLWHWPVYTLMRWTVGLDSLFNCTVAISLSLGLAWASYRFVERPPQRLSRIHRQPGWLVIATGLVLLPTGWLVARTIHDTPTVFRLSVVERNRLDWYPDLKPAAARDGRCATNQSSYDAIQIIPVNCSKTAKHIFVIGDSHANAFHRMLDNVSAITGAEVSIYTTSGCKAAALFPEDNVAFWCESFLQNATRSILAEAAPGDLLFLPSLRVNRLTNQDALVDSSPRKDMGLLNEEVEQADEFIAPFSSAGMRVIIELPLPIFAAPPFRCSDSFNRMNPICRQGLSMDRDFLQRHRAFAVQASRKLAATNSAVHLWDPFPVLCPTSPCKAFDGERPLFFDGDHLSGYGNEKLTDSFIGFLRALE